MGWSISGSRSGLKPSSVGPSWSHKPLTWERGRAPTSLPTPKSKGQFRASPVHLQRWQCACTGTPAHSNTQHTLTHSHRIPYHPNIHHHTYINMPHYQLMHTCTQTHPFTLTYTYSTQKYINSCTQTHPFTLTYTYSIQKYTGLYMCTKLATLEESHSVSATRAQTSSFLLRLPRHQFEHPNLPEGGRGRCLPRPTLLTAKLSLTLA